MKVISNKDKILDISKRLKLAHISSCLSVLPILEQIYREKEPEDLVIMDNAHAHLAHLVVREVSDPIVANYSNEEMMKANQWPERMIEKYGIHCDKRAGCDASGGSLGHAVGIALGYCLANKSRTVYVIISDGSSCEGSLGESLRLAKTLGIQNLKIHANFNSYTAVAKVDLDYFEQFIKGYGFPVEFHRTNNGLPELDGVKGHYLKVDEITEKR